MASSSARAEAAAAAVSMWKGLAVTISPLSGGLTNENYLVESGGKRYVMRLPGQSTELLSIDRENEVHNTKAAASTGIGPRVLEHVADLDVMVLEFIPARPCLPRRCSRCTWHAAWPRHSRPCIPRRASCAT